MNRILLKVRNDLIFSKRFIETTKYPVVSVKDIRNIGIIAHIDAGKTTVTERLLFLTGQTSIVGDVDDGNTVTDFMDLERERGITIQSAAVTSFWKNHRINLIDTPGHVDFTLEVERCLRVLDGAVTVLDASAGVQAQTLTVWRQANKFKVPCVFFINKMDKIGANFQKSLDSIENRLNQRVCAVTIPIFENSKFIGVVDLLKKKYLDIQNPKSDWSLIPENAKYFDELLYGREELFSRIGEINAEFAEKMLNSANLYNFPENVIISALKKSTIERSLAPVGCGTALRHNKTVEPVLDMIVDYLPNPLERNYHLPANDFCGLVFKIVHDKRKGKLSYVRVYKGELKHAQSVKNLNRNTVESGLKIFTPFSDDFQLSDKVTEGNIAVISGLSSTITGDTLIGAKEGKLKHETKLEGHLVNVLDGIDLPDSVFFCSIEPPNSGAIRAFEKALNELVIEDPSLKIRQDVETGQTILEGMGELHIEVIKERLNREYGLNVFMGPLRVGYREVIDSKVEETVTVEDSFAEIKFKQSCSLTFQIEPITDDTKFNKVYVDLDEETSSTPYVRPEWLKAINEGCKNALFNGPVLGFPVHNVKIVLKNLIASGGKINPALLSACASECVTKALKKSGAHLIEPVMLVEIHMIDEAAEQGMHGILQELARRRAILCSVTRKDAQGDSIVVEARIPLSETTGISNEIRSISSGLGALHMQFLEYEQVSEHEQAMLLERFHKRSAFG